MTGPVFLAWLVRWVHITAAVLAIGAPFFVRFALMPAAAKVLDEPTHQKLREAINARWRHFVYLLITLFIITGSYNFFVETRVNGVLITARWHDFDEDSKRTYQMLFGIKMLAAFALFFLASALAGRASAFAAIRKNGRLSVTILLLLGLLVLICATLMHMIPIHPVGFASGDTQHGLSWAWLFFRGN